MRKSRIILFNPNTSSAVTADMVALACISHACWATIEGRTASVGPSIILSEADLRQAEISVHDFGRDMAGTGWPTDAIVIAAFGDPGVASLRQVSPVPVIGIGEAALEEAAAYGGRFSIVTTTPDLESSIRKKAEQSGLTNLASLRLTAGSPIEVMSDPDRLDEALGSLISSVIDEDHPAAVVVAGGPLAASAHRLAPKFTIPVVDPVSAAFRRLQQILGHTGDDPHAGIATA